MFIKKKKNQLKVIVLELVDYSNQFNLGLIFVSKDATLKPPIEAIYTICFSLFE